MGVGLGVIATIVIITAYYIIHKKNNKTQKPLSMRNIVYFGEKGQYISENPMSSDNLTGNPNTLSLTTIRYSKNAFESSEREIFEPVTVRT
jgi:predicted small secreted protein